MAELTGMLIGQFIGILLWAAIFHAPVLRWRAAALFNWYISYKKAYLVSIKSEIIAVLLGDVAMLLVGYFWKDDALARLFGFAFGIIALWLALSGSLLKIADPAGSITAGNTREISASTIGFIFLLGFLISALFAVVIYVVTNL